VKLIYGISRKDYGGGFYYQPFRSGGGPIGKDGKDWLFSGRVDQFKLARNKFIWSRAFTHGKEAQEER
jgi:hypothetical protein